MMKKLTVLIFFLLALVFVSCTSTPQCDDLAAYVNPFVGTDGHGHTFPGAIVPFGMIQPSPDTRLGTWDGCSGYHYSDDSIYGFSHTHLSGTGVEDFCDILLMPFERNVMVNNEYYRQHFSHDNEVAEPGYYAVTLDNNIKVELTATERSAIHRYTFASDEEKGVLIDLTHRDKTLSCKAYFDQTKNMLLGRRSSAQWSPDQQIFFAITANQPITHIDYVKASEGVVVDNSKDCYAIIYFEPSVQQVELHVAISAVDEEGAAKNLAVDSAKTFDNAKVAARELWNNELGKIKVLSDNENDLKKFYSSLYHCFTAPYLFSDVDGRYRGQDHEIHTAAPGRSVYTVFSLWDTYRALHPLLTIIDRQRTADFIYTMLLHYEQGGELTMWELAAHETHCMIGNHSFPVILEAQRAGILQSFDADFRARLLDAMLATSNRNEGLIYYAQKGYVPSDIDNESVSKTLEYAFDDWCLAEYASALIALGEGGAKAQQAVEQYYKRCQSWQNLMDENNFMHARKNGGFVFPFSPTEVNNHFTEANSQQYSTYIPHDLRGYINMLGGCDAAEAFVDSLFHTTAQLEGRNQVDIDGLIGQYAHGNEPSHHAAYLYAYLGCQYKTAELVRKICNEFYKAEPNGLIGNEDCGQMSAWFVLSSMGLYQICPGGKEYVVGSPLFNKVDITLENGKHTIINCDKQSADNVYISNMKVDGSSNDGFIDIRKIQDGCNIDIEMSNKPTSFGKATAEQHITAIDDQYRITPTPYFTRWEQRFNNTAQVGLCIKSPQKDVEIYYTTDGSIPTNKSMRYEQPIDVADDIIINAVAYSPTSGYSYVETQKLTKFVADKRLTYITRPNPQYLDSGEEGLIDRLKGTDNYRIGGWEGWTDDAIVEIDLLQSKSVKTVVVDCLSDCNAWVFFPAKIEVEYSVDGKQFKPFGNLDNIADNAMKDTAWDSHFVARQSSFAVKGSATARYLRVKVVNYGKLPSWHVSAGAQAWVFIDEIDVH